ncbi:MAG: hypothetical protein ACRD16_10570 [Thermoanaerobaculia bacterium]
MRLASLSLCAALLAAAGTARAQAGPRPFSADFASGGRLRLQVRSGEVHIVGGDENKISVELSGKRAAEATDFQVRLKERGGATELRISGGPRNDVTVTIRIPRETDLYARIPFGEVQVENVVGNKDIQMHAGDLTVGVGNSGDYGHVEASVYTGELDGHPFGEEHGGLFRSFKKDGPGRYRLHAHVGAGQLTLE